VFIDLVIQHAMRTRHIVSCGMPDIKYLYVSTHKRHDFRKKKVAERKLWVLISSKTFV